MKNLMKSLGVALLALIAFNAAPLEAEDVPADWSCIGQSMVWDGETEQYMVCVEYVSQTCFDACDMYNVHCTEECTRTRCYLVI